MSTEKDEKAMQKNGAEAEGASEKRFKLIFFSVIAIAIVASVIILGFVKLV